MILCIDSGNSRIKWGIAAEAASAWLAEGVLAHEEVGALAGLSANWPRLRCVMLANVAGPAVEAAICAALGEAAGRMRVVRSASSAAGVVNRYENPEKLGVDRWCALIAARSLGISSQLVVMAGTATTIDGLDAEGNFLGGLILPGRGLMHAALARGTAGLPLAEGDYDEWPRRTDDAIASGAIEALTGAIERAWRRLPGEGRSCLLSGGDAMTLTNHLVIPHRCVENLPLLGLRVLASLPLHREA